MKIKTDLGDQNTYGLYLFSIDEMKHLVNVSDLSPYLYPAKSRL